MQPEFKLQSKIEARMASDYNVQFRAVHTNTLWRKSKHFDIENALRGKRGATELFAGRGEINYQKHGDPLYVIAWEKESAFGIAVKPDGNGDLLEHSFILDFDDDVGVPAEVLDRLFQSMSSKSSYWWVNHKQTYRSEIEGGYVWSPKANSNGARNQTYLNLTLARPGDIVFSYAGAEIRAVGVVIAEHQEQPKPEEFGLTGGHWSANGWLVPVEWVVLDIPISPKAHLATIAPLLPSKNSPLQSNGNGNQSCYLASISDDLGTLVLELARQGSPISVDRLMELEDQSIEDAQQAAIELDQSISPTEREQLTRARVGQGLFRQRVQSIEKGCRLTGITDTRFLVASHIKPWKVGDNSERLDGQNGLLLAPHVDKLFDRGWMTFEDNGDVLLERSVSLIISSWGLSGVTNVGSFSKEQRIFLQYHRDNVFKG